MCLWDVQLCMISLLYMVCNCNTFIIYQPLSTLFYFFVWKLIVFIHYNSKLLYFPITKISRGVMIFIPKNYFIDKYINLITLLDIFVIEKYSNFELWWKNTINFTQKIEETLSMCSCVCLESSLVLTFRGRKKKKTI